MEYLQQLLEKYWAGKLPDDKRAELLQLLERQAAGIRDESDLPSAGSDQPVLSDSRSRAVLETLHQKIADLQPAPVVRRNFPWKLLAAASIILVVAITLMIPKPQPQTLQPTAAPPVIAASHIKTLSNKTHSIQYMQLEDGSAMTLYPSATIIQSFTEKGRNIILEGQALFSVVHDKNRPFTVRSGDLLTTVLGTRFLVNTHAASHHTQVRLLEGKVMVESSSGKQIYLKPGEEWLVDNTSRESRLHNWAATENKQIHTAKNIDTETLEFTRMNLSDVFKRVGRRQNVIIRWTDRSIDHMTFTGRFLPGDSLETILNVICNTNDLLFQQENDTVTIKKMN